MEGAGLIARIRLGNQRLIGAPLGSPAEVVRHFGAVQAQDYGGAKWGIAQRLEGAVDADLDAAVDSGALIRTHALRPTWHFVTPKDVRWVLQLTGPRVQKANASGCRQLGLDDATLREGAEVMVGALQGSTYLTRRELVPILEASGVGTDGQRMPYLLMHAELEALICSGPRRGKQRTYAVLEERVAPAEPLERDQALIELIMRYFTSHGPATVQDFSWWSGLTVSDARRGIEMAGSALSTEEIDERTYYGPADTVPTRLRTPIVHLLPNYDEYLGSYKDYGPIAALVHGVPRYASALQGNIVILDGRVIGGWRRKLRAKEVDFDFELLVDLDDRLHRAIERASGDYARFIGKARAGMQLHRATS